MLSCISIGISEYTNRNLASIPCAANDAHAVYDAFQQIMGAEFNSYLSICVSNIRSTDFISLLTVVSDVIDSSPPTSDSTLVVYFSGHGVFDEKSFELRFPEFKGNGRNSDDSFPAEQFLSIFKGKDIKILIILDCCNSGAALPIASDNDQGPEVSVLAAVNSYETAKFSKNGSDFTKVLCKSIYEIDCSGEVFSLNSLVDRIVANGYTSAFVHRGAAQELDLVFRSPLINDGFDKYFSTLFVDRIAQSNILSREAIWYSLNNFSDKRVYETSELYFDIDSKYGRKLPPEASWLVRRAIGSTLANHVSYPSIFSLLNRLLESEYWQEQCIALIGLRYLIREDYEICKRVINLVIEKKIYRVDAVWLACLYTSENKRTDWKVFIETSLALTPWGMIELCKAHKLFNENLDDYDCLRNHCFYEKLILEKKRQEKKGNTKLEQYVYSGKTRGRLPENTQAKFLLSALYGNWRDQILLSLRPYIECYRREQVLAELQEFRCVDNAERKMALFAYFSKEYEEALLYSDALKWGLNDMHPWVRRTAMEFYEELGIGDEFLKDSFFSIRFNEGYPGLLDFYLTCPISLRQSLITYLESESVLSRGDFLSLEQSFSCE